MSLLVQSIKSQIAIKAGRDAKNPASAVATGRASMPTPIQVPAIKRVDPTKWDPLRKICILHLFLNVFYDFTSIVLFSDTFFLLLVEKIVFD
jgi:hypothetical protein